MMVQTVFLWLFYIVLATVDSLRLDTEHIWAQTDERFLSVAIDSHLVGERWKNFDFKSKKVQNLAAALSPAYFRLGGTAADLAVFTEKDDKFQAQTSLVTTTSSPTTTTTTTKKDCYCTTSGENDDKKVCEDIDGFYKKGKFSMTGLDWMAVNDLCRSAGWKLLFDVNVLLRTETGWDPTNLRQLLKFSTDLGYTDMAFELGNEPNNLYGQLGLNLTGTQLGKDFYRLKNVLKQFPLYENSTLVGPDVNEVYSKLHGYDVYKYVEDVYKASKGVLDAITWHHYYVAGGTVKLHDFLNVKILNSLAKKMESMQKFMQAKHITRPLWLGETASAYNGGANGLSNRYAGTFMWMDKLGLAALYNYQVVIRQTFYHGCYALIGEDLLPNPDYWVSVLHKRLVSSKVLHLMHDGTSANTTRTYAHCSREYSGGITLFALNLAAKMAKVSVEFATKSPVQHYYLTAAANQKRLLLTGRDILLNGETLLLNIDDELPQIEPILTDPLSELWMPPLSSAFWVFPNANVKICEHVQCH